jgi:hypothetical protein
MARHEQYNHQQDFRNQTRVDKSRTPSRVNELPFIVKFGFFAILVGGAFSLKDRIFAANPLNASGNTNPPPGEVMNQDLNSSGSNDTYPAEFQLSSSYPENILQWEDLIEDTAVEYGLDPNFIAAVMSVESGGNPDAYSSSGAVGLMQVMPRDGLAASFVCVNGPCFANRPSMEELYDPEFNLDYAGGMLDGLINKHGNWRDALFAYGPPGVGFSYADKVLGVYERNK